MVDNKKPELTEDKIAQDFGYPNAEVRQLSNQLVTLGWKLSLGDASVRDEYYATLDEALANGWSPDMLDGQQEVMVGAELHKEMREKHKALQEAARLSRLPGDGLLDS
jgi:hypothetical protein